MLSLMLGEFNASHMGISAPVAGGEGPPRGSVGKLGLRFDSAEYLNTGKLRITEIMPLGPAAVAGNIKRGRLPHRSGGRPIAANTSLDEMLDHKVNTRVVLTITDTAGKREVAGPPRPLATEKELIYRAMGGSAARLHRQSERRATGLRAHS